MAKTNTKKTNARKAGSPPKKKGFSAKETKIGSKAPEKIEIIAYKKNEFNLVVYVIQSNKSKQPFIYPICQHIDGLRNITALEDHDLQDHVPQRATPGGPDEAKKSGNYKYKVLVQVKDDVDDLSDDVIDGTCMAIKNVMMDKAYNQWPATNISYRRGDDDTPLDHQLMNVAIEMIMKSQYETDILNETFVANFPELAELIYSCGEYSGEFGASLGF